MKFLSQLKYLCYTSICLPFVANATLINVFSPTVYDHDTAAMDAALGITGYEIETFNDKTLIDGFSFATINPDTDPMSELPNVLTDGRFNWDDDQVLSNAGGGSNVWGAPWAQGISFFFDGGIGSFGIGMAQIETNHGGLHQLFVNDVQVGNLEDYAGFVSSGSLNGYLKIDAEMGESIHSVTIKSTNVNRDGMIFDHLAINRGAVSIPEPGTTILMVLSLMLLLSRSYLQKR